MRPIQVSAEVPLPQDTAWDVMWGDGGPPRFLDDMHRLGYWRDVDAIEDYRVGPDGMPSYRLVRKFGPLPAVRMTSEYDVFDPPRRAVNHAVDTPFRGDFTASYEPTGNGTRITWRWEVGASNPVLGVVMRAARPYLARSLQRNLDEYAKGACAARS